MHIGKWTWPLVFVAAFAATSLAQAKVIEDQPGSLKTLTTIGDALDAPDHHPVHVLYVHGIDQIGAGDSSLLRQSICTKLNLCDLGDWKNADEWHAAAPLLCIGWSGSAAIARRWWSTRSTGGHWFWRSSAAA